MCLVLINFSLRRLACRLCRLLGLLLRGFCRDILLILSYFLGGSLACRLRRLQGLLPRGLYHHQGILPITIYYSIEGRLACGLLSSRSRLHSRRWRSIMLELSDWRRHVLVCLLHLCQVLLLRQTIPAFLIHFESLNSERDPCLWRVLKPVRGHCRFRVRRFSSTVGSVSGWTDLRRRRGTRSLFNRQSAHVQHLARVVFPLHREKQRPSSACLQINGSALGDP